MIRETVPLPGGNWGQWLRIWFIRNNLLATESVLLKSKKTVFLTLPSPCGPALPGALLACDMVGQGSTSGGGGDGGGSRATPVFFFSTLLFSTS